MKQIGRRRFIKAVPAAVAATGAVAKRNVSAARLPDPCGLSEAKSPEPLSPNVVHAARLVERAQRLVDALGR